MLDILNDLKILIEHEEARKEGLKNEMQFNGVEQETTSILKELLNKACNELYLGCS